MTRFIASSVFVSLLAILSIVTPAAASGTDGPIIWSDGVDGATTRTGSVFGTRCGSGSANATEEADTLALIDDWATEAASESFGYISPAITPADGISGDEAVLGFPGVSGTTVTVSRRQILPADAHDPTNTSVGALSNNSRFSDSARLQDCSPRPANLTTGPAGTSLGAVSTFSGIDPNPATFWNATTFPAGNQLDAALFEFSEPIGAFGLWFGDLESRTPDLAGGGVLARVKLFDSAGDVIHYAEILPDLDPATDADCGGSAALSDQSGECGNQETRFIGFVDPDETVASMIVIVGDDDSCTQTSSCNGITEYLSWIGPILSVRQPDLVVEKSISQAPVNSGDSITWDLVITNNGQRAAAAGWSVTDVPGAGISGVSLSGEATEVDCAAGLSCTGLDALNPGDSVTVQATGTVTAGIGEAINNAAYVSPAPDDVPELVEEGTPPNPDEDTSATDTNNDANTSLLLAPAPTTTTTAPATTTTQDPTTTTIAETTTTGSATTQTTIGTQQSEALAQTGSSTTSLLLTGSALVLLGIAAAVPLRRRESA